MRRISAALLVLMLAGATIAAQETGRPAGKADAAAMPGSVNLNTATAAQLEALPGIGPAVAQRIVEYRQKSGGFKKVEELMNVRGIGETTFLKLKTLITITAPRAERAAAQ